MMDPLLAEQVPDSLLTGDESIQATNRPASATMVEAIVAGVCEELLHQQLPTGTYRLQFNGQFTFQAATGIAPYLSQLGISHVYASPFLKARRGSIHGYDIVDYNKLNPEVGSEADFELFVNALQKQGLHQILDMVPNHMGVATDENAWWQDVLENGSGSCCASFFDIDWRPLKQDLENKVLLPVLGDQFGRILEQGELLLHYEEGVFFLTYHERRFPIAPPSFSLILGHRCEELKQLLGAENPHLLEYQSILTAIGHLPPRETVDSEQRAERQREQDVVKRRLGRLSAESPETADFIAENVSLFNGRIGTPQSFDLLDKLLQAQAYRLSCWRVAADEINYRRFFDINELAAVCMERPEVFDRAHAYVLRLLENGAVAGLRIDHADGLYDPTGYLWKLQERRFLQLCRRMYDELAAQEDFVEGQTPAWPDVETPLLQQFAGQRSPGRMLAPLPLYLVVEKILEGKERLPDDWPVHGTTGYDFTNQVNGLFVAADQSRALDNIYTKFIGERIALPDLVHNSKKLIIKFSMSSELNALGHQLDRISERNRWSRDFTLNGLTYALREVVAWFPIYRTYVSSAGVLERDRQYIEQAVARAKRHNAAGSQESFDFVRDVLLLNGVDRLPPDEREERLQFVGRFQQFTGPMMAKAVEDTAFYTFNRLISLNEVGGDPQQFGRSIAEFHQQNRERQAVQPFGLLASTTHDTKRSEDVRARINVLSEIPAEWKQNLFAWTRWNKRKKVKVDGELAPSRNDEYLIYQTLIGTWPFESPRGPALPAYVERIQTYMIKALREAKVHTSWIAPYDAYEQATRNFVAAIAADIPLTAFRQSFEPFAARIARLGMWNSLSQAVLKFLSPGVPDVYQGSELWDFRLVDPDNRGPVDYEHRRQLLDELTRRQSENPDSRARLAAELVAAPIDGRIKLYLTQRCLSLRRQYPDLCTRGDYLPLALQGKHLTHVCAFGRSSKGQSAIVIAPVRIATLMGQSTVPPTGAEAWGDTRITLPEKLAGTAFRDLFTGQLLEPSSEISVGQALSRFPVAVLVSVPHAAVAQSATNVK